MGSHGSGIHSHWLQFQLRNLFIGWHFVGIKLSFWLFSFRPNMYLVKWYGVWIYAQSNFVIGIGSYLYGNQAEIPQCAFYFGYFRTNEMRIQKTVYREIRRTLKYLKKERMKSQRNERMKWWKKNYWKKGKRKGRKGRNEAHDIGTITWGKAAHMARSNAHRHTQLLSIVFRNPLLEM